MQKADATYDVLIFGGGITGLWLLDQLCAQGYAAALLEAGDVGGVQTVASQGILHGGMKYSLQGRLSKATKRLADVPDMWRAALAGDGPVDLRPVRIAAQQHLMWLPARFSGVMISFFASRAVAANSQRLKPLDYPELLQNPGFTGELLALDELVLDAVDLTRLLVDRHRDRIGLIDWPDGVSFEFQRGGAINAVRLASGATELRLSAKKYVMAAGAGNAALAQRLNVGGTARQQIRPLHMVTMQNAPGELFLHAIDGKAAPRFTLTSHRQPQAGGLSPSNGGDIAWYMGGGLAETGVDLTSETLIARAQEELQQHLPWLDLSAGRWSSHHIDRAEGLHRLGRRPNGPVLKIFENFFVAWPTKLVLAPVIAAEIMSHLNLPGGGNDSVPLEQPALATPPWAPENGIEDTAKTADDKAPSCI